MYPIIASLLTIPRSGMLLCGLPIILFACPATAYAGHRENPGPGNSSAEAVTEALTVSVSRRRTEAWELALKIWKAAEPGYQETQSSAALAAWLDQKEFRISREVAGIPTAFTAEFGEGKPVIGILGEFDALPGLSQTAEPAPQPRDDGNGYGHGCGHHLFGVASASAAVALAEQIRAGTLTGTVRYYGCPAEEGGSAKVFMVREGLFKDCDAVLHWHPSSQNRAGDRSTLSRIAVKFRFHGRSAHAAGSPESGRSALDAVELTNHAAELLREHCPEETRIHHVITFGGEAPNVVPNFAEVYFYIRHPKAEVLRPLYARLVRCAEGAAIATETRLEIRNEGGTREILPNQALSAVTLQTLRELNDLEYNEDELRFAARIREYLPEPKPVEEIASVEDVSGTTGKGSTDVGDISWVVPTTGFGTACWVPGTPGHSWQAVACGGTSIAEKGMHLAAEVMAVSAARIMQDADLILQAKQELLARRGDSPYQSLMEPDQKPPLDYRRPTVR